MSVKAHLSSLSLLFWTLHLFDLIIKMFHVPQRIINLFHSAFLLLNVQHVKYKTNTTSSVPILL